MNMGALRVQRRDLAVVEEAFRHRIVRRDDLIALGHFASVSRCNERLSKLVTAGWLRRIASVNGLEQRQGLYAIGPKAVVAVSQRLDLPHEEVARQSTPNEGPILVEHSLRTLDFRCALQREALAQGIFVEEWLGEQECLHEFEVGAHRASGARSIVVKPDGFFTLQSKGSLECVFLETDLGHVSLPRFQDKLCRYGTHSSSGAFEDAYVHERFSVVTITVGERRLRHLAGLEARGFPHFLTTWERIGCDAGVFGCPWTSHDGVEGRLLDLLSGGANEILP